MLRTLPVVESAYFVDAARGDDANSGTQAAPFATISRALIATRASGGGGAIVLRDGAVLEEGNYAALLARKGVFAELITAQTIGADFVKEEPTPTAPVSPAGPSLFSP